MATHPEHLLARAADGADLTQAERSTLDAHLAVCAECRDELEWQQLIAGTLQRRPRSAVHPEFSAQVSARIDGAATQAGFLDLANWRAWTVGLAPVAALLVLIAYLGVGSTPATTATTTTTTETAITFDNWASRSVADAQAAVFLQPGASGDQLLETVLTGAAPGTGESNNVR